ncbi:MAG TPA: hypothetical protein VFQ80_18430 [Thermomicrobiales bacterium]|jgi:hypothetical protein|nr:hypothetical protein [Thermomicrobiales bacterium]
MGKRANRNEAKRRLDEAAKTERRLLKQERRAERDLAAARDALRDDEARLARAQDRVERRRADVAAAAARLRERQADRARGPAPAAAPPADDGCAAAS